MDDIVSDSSHLNIARYRPHFCLDVKSIILPYFVAFCLLVQDLLLWYLVLKLLEQNVKLEKLN